MSTTFGRLGAILGLLLLAGCATSPSSPATASVTAPPPAPAVELPPASLTGSEETSTMLDNFTAFVTAIDGLPVGGGRAGWNTPLVLKAGPRRVGVGFIRGVFTAQATVDFVATSAAAYQVRFATDAQLFGQNSYCEFWIVDLATNQTVSPRVRTGLTRIEPAAKSGG